MQYFEARGVTPSLYENYQLPIHLKKIIENLQDGAKVLDFGCGFGQNILSIMEYAKNINKKIDIFGIDICQEAIDYCRSRNLSVDKVDDIFQYDIGGGGHRFNYLHTCFRTHSKTSGHTFASIF